MSYLLRAAICTAACVAAAPALAQTAPATPTAPTAQPAAMPFPTKPVRETGLRYYMVETIVAKPGAQLWSITRDHLIPAARAAGGPVPIVYHTDTGPGRTVVIVPLSGGLVDMEYAVSLDDVKFMAALAKQEGSQEKAMALLQRYNDGVESRTREIYHDHIVK